MHDKKLEADKARAVIEALMKAGEGDLAKTLSRHVEGRARGEDPSALAELWLRT